MNSENPIYLDYNATTPLLPEVVDAMLPYLRELFGNPSSGHAFGQVARRAVEKARRQVAALIGCDDDEIIFTSGGTESNNLAIRGVTEALPSRRHLVTSVLEHPAVASPCDWLERHGWRVARLTADWNGQVGIQEAEETVGAETGLVTVMHSNNETGVLQPIRELAEIAQKAGSLIHTDAAQSVGKVPINVRVLGVDLLSLAGHKLYAPKGIGALFVKRGTPLRPFMMGAGQERGLRPGTENVASIVGLGAACEAAMKGLESTSSRIQDLRDELWNSLSTSIPGLALNGHPKDRLPNTLNVRFPGVQGMSVLNGAPEVAASTGSACHDGHETASQVITAMGVSTADALGSIRLSLGRDTSKGEVTRAASALIRSWNFLAAVLE